LKEGWEEYDYSMMPDPFCTPIQFFGYKSAGSRANVFICLRHLDPLSRSSAAKKLQLAKKLAKKWKKEIPKTKWGTWKAQIDFALL
jgi:hypothetical protein